jgi:sugar phosphate isomerase/epimerase
MGYTHVETAGEYGGMPERAAKLFADLGLTVCSAHIDLPNGAKKQQTLDTIAALGTNTLVCAWRPPEKFQSLDGIKSVCDELNEATVNAPHLRIAYHNHHFECLKLADGSLPLLKMRDLLSASVLFEVDVYWVQAGGVNPAELLGTLGERAALLHMKDGAATTDAPMLALGEGVMRLPEVVAASKTDTYIVELDRCATDMLEAVGKSYLYLKGILHA